MLVEFKVKNFKSFKDEQTLSLVASVDKNLTDNTLSTAALKGTKLATGSVMYGANASGKSNLVAAFHFIKQFIHDSAQNRPDTPIPVQPFRLDPENIKAPTEFEISFIHRHIRYEYGFSVDHERVHEEWLIAYPKGVAQTWFERPATPDAAEADWYFGRHLKGEKGKLVSLTRSNALFLSVAAQFNHRQLSIIYEWFTKFLHIVSDNMPTRSLEFVTITDIRRNPELYAKIRNLMRIADLGIVDFAIEEVPIPNLLLDLPPATPPMIRDFASELSKLPQSGGEQRQLKLSMRHQGVESRNTDLKFDFDDESRGTKKLFGLSGPVFNVLETGSVLVVDELDSSLHPLLARELIEMFNNPKINPKGAQIIFNTHDTTILDLTLFRRDQIWFIEKDDNGASHLYSLLDFKPRKTEAISKGYLQGRYGAIPFLSNVEEFLADGS